MNDQAMVALGAGVLVAMLGLVATRVRFLFNGAWFSASVVSFVVYWLLMRRRTSVLPRAGARG